MKNWTYISIVTLVFVSNVLLAQVQGQWEGTLEENGKEYRFELLLKKTGRKITGRTFIHLSDSLTIEMDATGYWHEDRSMNLYDQLLIQPTLTDSTAINAIPRRTYQLIYSRSFNDRIIEGWWQERDKGNFDPKRNRGLIYLKKVSHNKA